MKRTFLFVLAFGVAAASPGGAGEVFVTEDIEVSTTWTADNVYRLEEQVFVLPGATLTIEAGTVVASRTGVGGSLAVMPGARIYINGTATDPVIMTSTADVATWDLDPSHPTGGNPKSGTWREGVNEWGNLTILGRGLISGSHYGGQPIDITTDDDGVPGGSTTTRRNTKVPDGLNRRQMEGLEAAFPGDPRVLYGGNDDDDDSGSISYLSLRYGGKVIGLANELNGLSLGGVGRGTDIHHVEIMNNVDDGVEIWGGTVNLKYISIWNIGDDSFDIDQGWRGKTQFGLIVQGHSADASQGSGVGDNAFEMDGAEDSDAQPVTTATVYNYTVVGQPIDGDHGTAWRDNARAQFRNCIFMELGERLVNKDNVDGDGANGYGYNGTLSWEATWTTDYTVTSPVNAGSWTPGAFNDPAVLYTAQTSGKLAEISDCVFYNNLFPTAYNEADARGVRDPANHNVTADRSPIRSLTRSPLVTRGGKKMLPVVFIDPRPANDALTSVGAAPGDGFFTPAAYRGAFAPGDNWLIGWTAAHAFKMTCAAGDNDADGLCNDVEGPNNALPAGWSNEMLFDSDGDGLSDRLEDANANGIPDAGETSTRNRDTDGDNFIDGLDPNPLAIDAGYTDADQDGLHDPSDPDAGNPDFDGDRYKDGYDAAVADASLGTGAGVPNLGDANGDNFVTSLDALAAQSYFLTLIDTDNAVFDQGLPKDSFIYMDANRDGVVSNFDALVMQTFFLSLLPYLPL